MTHQPIYLCYHQIQKDCLILSPFTTGRGTEGLLWSPKKKNYLSSTGTSALKKTVDLKFIWNTVSLLIWFVYSVNTYRMEYHISL